MNSLLFVNPIRAGMLEEYKQFLVEITGPRLEEYESMMKRYYHIFYGFIAPARRLLRARLRVFDFLGLSRNFPVLNLGVH